MDFDVVTLFPEFFYNALECGVLRLAQQKKLVKIGFTNPRDFSGDGFVDDYQFGGGAGMVMKPEPLVKAISRVRKATSCIVNLTPQGRLLDQALVKEFTKKNHIILICGRYKGVDSRVEEIFEPLNVSIGDYVLAGGEIAALAIMESVIRLVPGVIGNKDSAESDSLQDGSLEGPIYTRPANYGKLEVPPILRNGNHKAIAEWRKKESLKLTLNKRPDLFPRKNYTKNDLGLLMEVLDEKDARI